MKKTLLYFAFVVLSAVACNKAPGEGGTSSISGKVYAYDLNAPGIDTTDSYYAMDEDVFILYGEDDSTYDDKFSTSFDGSYRFDNLTPGKYTIFVYSRCDACPDKTEIRSKSVEISEKKKEYKLGDIIILK